ncbi:MAG TPA: Omp28-related outer membrane protein, partial [Candidatus Krumholzibacteria bacterium]|nr:Omp28-related outer membrane protein [Candidatus Krumholzibacteria bacterium]
MRRFPLAAALLLLALAAEAQVPRAVLSELNSATWCGYCPRARAGLDVMLGRYDSIEFDTIDIMASSGGLSCPDSDARIAYYAVSGYPTLEFNGGNTMVGAGTDAIDGGVYDPVVRSLLDDPTPVAMAITDHAFVAGAAHVDVHVALEGDLPAGGSPRLRVALVEDGLSYSGVAYDNVLRGIIADLDLAIAAAGESVDKTFAFTMDPAWNAANLRAVAFVQDDADRAILQACNTRPAPAYGLRYYAAGTTTVVGAGEVVFDAAGLFNTGLNADVYTVSLDTANLPAGGSAHVTGNAGSFSSADVALAPGERALFHVAVDIG